MAPRAPREAVYNTVYPLTASQYYDLMLSRAFQRDVHVNGMRMAVWDAVDSRPELGPPGALTRVVYSEPRLRLPDWLAKAARKSQAYTEYSEFDPVARTRRTRVVPKVGANVMDFTVEERYVDRAGVDGRAECVVRSVVRVRVKVKLFRTLLEKWIIEQSELKVAQRDAYVLGALAERAYDDLLSTAEVPIEEVVGESVGGKGSGWTIARAALATALIVVTRLVAARSRDNRERSAY